MDAKKDVKPMTEIRPNYKEARPAALSQQQALIREQHQAYLLKLALIRKLKQLGMLIR